MIFFKPCRFWHRWQFYQHISLWTDRKICTDCGLVQESFHEPGMDTLQVKWKDIFIVKPQSISCVQDEAIRLLVEAKGIAI